MQLGLEEDRHGHLYPHGISPDVLIDANPSAKPASDPVLRAAQAWLAGLR